MASDLLGLVTSLLPKQKTAESHVMDMAKASTEKGRDYIYNIVKSYFPNQAVQEALMASIQHETDGTFDPTIKQYGGGPGRGLFQMEGKMLEDYNKYLRDFQLSDNADNQLGFMQNVIHIGSLHDIGSGNRKKLQSAISSGNSRDILDVFTNKVERPGKPMMDKRIKLLEENKKYISGGK